MLISSIGCQRIKKNACDLRHSVLSYIIKDYFWEKVCNYGNYIACLNKVNSREHKEVLHRRTCCPVYFFPHSFEDL